MHTARKDGAQLQFAFENPQGSLAKRPYMQPDAWPDVGDMYSHAIDLCAFGLLRKKPTHLWTSLPQRPRGDTGTGRCDRLCRHGFVNPKTGQWVHPDPLNHYRGSMEDKARMPEQLVREVIVNSLQCSPPPDGMTPVVIDLFAGSCVVSEVAESLGMRCISVDIKRPAKAKQGVCKGEARTTEYVKL